MDEPKENFWSNLFKDKPLPPRQMTEEEALEILRSIPAEEIHKADPTELLRVGTKLHFTKRSTLPQKIALGILSPKLALERGIVRDSPGGRDILEPDVHIAQVTLLDLKETTPLGFLRHVMVSNYSQGDIGSDGLLTRVGVLVDPMTEGLIGLREREEGLKDPDKESIWYAPEIPRERINGFVLVDAPDAVYFNHRNRLPFEVLQGARQKTVQWFQDKILPYHMVPLYSQANGALLFDPNKTF